MVRIKRSFYHYIIRLAIYGSYIDAMKPVPYENRPLFNNYEPTETTEEIDDPMETVKKATPTRTKRTVKKPNTKPGKRKRK